MAIPLIDQLTKGIPSNLSRVLPSLIRLRIGDERDGHPSCFLDLVRLDLRKNNLLAQAERIIAATIEGPIRDPLEIANSRQCDVNQSVEKLVHALLPQA